MRSPLSPRTTVLAGMILLAALSRLIPHPPNFAPITAMALFGAAHFDRKWKVFVVPLAAMFISDMGLEILFRLGLSPAWGLHSLMWVVYATFALIAGMGLWLRSRVRLVPVAGTVLASSLVFFVVTNLGVWALGSWYPKTPEGLIACYTAAIPFFHNTLLGDTAYSTALFGGFALAAYRFPVLRSPALVQA